MKFLDKPPEKQASNIFGIVCMVCWGVVIVMAAYFLFFAPTAVVLPSTIDSAREMER